MAKAGAESRVRDIAYQQRLPPSRGKDPLISSPISLKPGMLHCPRTGSKVIITGWTFRICGTLTTRSALIYEQATVQQSPRGRGNLTSNTFKAVLVAVFLTALGACSSQVTVNAPTIPDPLVDRIPISVAVKFPDAFEHFVHQENVIGKEKWTIDLGRSNILLFTKLFDAMFEEFTVADDSVDPRDLPIDAWIEPSIDAFEFSVPSQSQTPSFAVWIRYRIKIFDSGGKQFANWPISAYGKSLSTTMGGDDALRRAAVLAMRDAAALVIMQMDRATGISSLNRETLSKVAASPEAAMPDPALPEDAPEETQATASEDTTDETG